MPPWWELVGLVVALLGIPAGYIGRIGLEHFRTSREVRELKTLLNFGRGDLYVVFPQRDEVAIKNAILPRGASEDFFAIDNLSRVLQRMGQKHYHLRTADVFMAPGSMANWSNNVVTIGSPRSNMFTRRALRELKSPFKFGRDRKGVWWVRRDQDPGKCKCKSRALQQQEANARKIQQEANARKKPAAELALDDVAVIAKYRNPFSPNNDNLLLMIAGVRGIGTWGATHYLREKAGELYERKGGRPKSGWLPILTSYRPNGKDGEFIAFVSIKYENFSIAGTELEDKKFVDIT
jgi:hypothetical protein